MLQLISPAKLNLFLRVTGKRRDGYHDIHSLFQAIDLCDRITIEISNNDSITCSDLNIPQGKENLVWRSLEIFRWATGKRDCYCVYIDKEIPSQAGLGGGSSNAATVLWGLNALYNFPVDEADLLAWSKIIGSDVPFFFTQGTAFLKGHRGNLEDLKYEGPESYWVIKPSEGLSTQEIFSRFKFKSSKKEGISLADVAHGNDLEEPAFEVLPSLKNLKRDLVNQGFSDVLMTGSGTAFFCRGGNEAPKDIEGKVFKVRPLNRKEREWYTL